MEKPRYCGECGGQYFFPRDNCAAWVCHACGYVETEDSVFPRPGINLAVDCEVLLRKYIAYIKQVEGESFIPDSMGDSLRFTTHSFSEAELAKLHELKLTVEKRL